MKQLNVSCRALLFVSLFVVVFHSACRKEKEIEIIPTPEEMQSASAEQARLIPDLVDSYVAESWYDLLNRLIITTPGRTPPVAARDIGYTGIALYEAAAGGMFLHHSLAGRLDGLLSLPRRQPFRVYAPAISANAALARILKNLFANTSAANFLSIDSLEAANHTTYSLRLHAEINNRSRDFGYAIADAIFEWSKSDGGHEAYLDAFPSAYIPPVGDGLWTSTPPLLQPAMFPYWGGNRTFLPGNGPGPIDPPAPPAFSSQTDSRFYKEAYTVFETVNNLTQEQKDIANYWADGGGTFTPPGHLISIAAQVIRNRKLSLGQAAGLLAAVGIGLNDAAIVCWRGKYNYNLLRPITYIRNYIDSNWVSYIGTPPFPSYTSGHSTFSGTAAKILSLRFGNQFAFADSSKLIYGFTPRSFSSFEQAAEEAAISRLYGGIHYEFDNDEGLRCGVLIANNVARLRLWRN